MCDFIRGKDYGESVVVEKRARLVSPKVSKSSLKFNLDAKVEVWTWKLMTMTLFETLVLQGE